jgi:hypothetical protein
MGLVPCPDCGSEMSTAAFVCPKCGRPNKALGKRIGKKVAILWGLLIVMFLAVWQLLNR